MAYNYRAMLYRIVEEAHKGCNDEYIHDLCRDAANEFKVDHNVVYRDSKRVYEREFA